MWMTFAEKLLGRSETKEPRIWKPSTFVESSTDEYLNKNYAVVVLNRPINLEQAIVKELWTKAKCRCLVDGGANRWLNFLHECSDLSSLASPELITGDFDSITDKTMSFFKQLSIPKIIHTPSQDFTDFTKSLMELSPYLLNGNIGCVVVLMDVSGRIDHIFAHIQSLVNAQDFLPNVIIYILSRDSISWLLNTGQHTIHVPKTFVDKQLWCSFVPIDGKCCVTTTGLKWNLDCNCSRNAFSVNDFVQFGGIVSTSNTYASDVVTIQSDGLLYWSMGITELET